MASSFLSMTDAVDVPRPRSAAHLRFRAARARERRARATAGTSGVDVSAPRRADDVYADAFAGARVLVLGGGGFLGAHLCARLLRAGANVTAVDSWITGRPGNVTPLLGHPAFSMATADASVDVPWSGSLDAIVHLASPASPIDYAAHPIDTLRAGSLATLRAVELAAATGARLLFASTSEVYGDPLVHPQPETYTGNVDPVGPRAVYDEAKRFGEAAVAAAGRAGVRTGIARIFNTVGPLMRADDGRMVPAFTSQVLAGTPLVIHGDGSQTRSVADVDDTVEGLLRLLASDHPGPINIGNPDEHTVVQIATWVAAALGELEPSFTFVPLPQGDPVRRCPDITLAREALGWEPTRSAWRAVTRTAVWLAHAGATVATERSA
jgi:dTDP-glucose 4,6-dehydratase